MSSVVSLLTDILLLGISHSDTSIKLAAGTGLSVIVAAVVDKWKTRKQQESVAAQQLFKTALVDQVAKTVAIITSGEPVYSIVTDEGVVKLMTTNAVQAVDMWIMLRRAASGKTYAFMQDGQVREKITPSKSPTSVSMSP